MDLRRNESYYVPTTPRKNNDFQGRMVPRNNPKVIYLNNTSSRDYVNSSYCKPTPSLPNGYVSKKCNNYEQRPNVLNVISYSPAKRDYLKNYSLPHSPVCEEEFSSMGCQSSRNKRYSCSFYVDINSNGDRTVESAERADDDRYSSDSLDEDNAENDSPRVRRRRCVSEYQLSWVDSNVRKDVEENVMRSHWNGCLSDINRSHSEENILNDCDSLQEHSDRHSSASFFLRKRKAFNSSESILTDESEYQFLFSNKEVFHSTESVLTDASDSNLNSASDDANLVEETTWSQLVKKPVLRTRSLQDGCQQPPAGGELTRFFVTQKEVNSSCDTLDHVETRAKPKNESFFIPVEGNAAAKSPEEVKEMLMKKINSRKRQEKSSNEAKVLDHPVVAHKPPKPQTRSVSMYLSNSKTYRKNKLPGKAKKSPPATAAAEKEPDKYGTFTKSKANLGKNLLKNHFPAAKATAKMSNVTAGEGVKTDFLVWSKNSRNEMLKRNFTITKYDLNALNCQIKDDRLSANVRSEMARLKRHSLPTSLVPLNQLTGSNATGQEGKMTSRSARSIVFSFAIACRDVPAKLRIRACFRLIFVFSCWTFDEKCTVGTFSLEV